MCKPKTEGGQRCAHHLGQGVRTGMTAFAASVTTLSQAETTAAFEDLVREGASQPDPTRDQVDAFLNEQCFRVRHEPLLTEKKRSSILSRLGAGIGKIMPDGATFHAWKNVLAESWARSRRRFVGVFLVSALATGVGGCATGPSSASTPPAHSVTASAPVTPGPAASTGAAEKPYVEKAQFDEAVVKKVGQAAAQAAYDSATDYTLTHAVDPKLMATDPAKVTAADFASVREGLTPTAQAAWDKEFAARADLNHRTNVYALSWYGLNYEGYSVRTDVAPVQGFRVENPKVAVNGDRLVVTQDVKAMVRCAGPNGTYAKMKADKTMTYWMARDGKGWKIDGWSATFHGGNAIADTK